MDKILAIENNEHSCWKCLQQKEKIHTIEIYEMGYGGQFDCISTKIQLCEECYQESIKDNQELWNMEEVQCEFDKESHGFTEYKYELEMLQYIQSLPIQSQQFVKNEFEDGWNSDVKMNPQDWIDYQLSILPHDKCKEYMLYSPEEIEAYQNRFPTCKFVHDIDFKDGSKCSECPRGAFGRCGGVADEYNISTECYECQSYIDKNDKAFKTSKSYLKLCFKYLNGTISRPEMYLLVSNEKYEKIKEAVCKMKRLINE